MVAPSSSQMVPSSRRIELTLGAVIVVFFGLLAYGVYDLANGSGARRTPAASTVASPPTGVLYGGNSSLVQLETPAAIGAGWSMRVVSVLRDVSQSILGIPHPRGAQNIVVEFTLKYGRAGRGNSQAVLDAVKAIGTTNTVYAPKTPCLGTVGRSVVIDAGHAATRAACFTVDSRDARSLELLVAEPGTNSSLQATGQHTWFALR
jgi:hypothetical protein